MFDDEEKEVSIKEITQDLFTQRLERAYILLWHGDESTEEIRQGYRRRLFAPAQEARGQRQQRHIEKTGNKDYVEELDSEESTPQVRFLFFVFFWFLIFFSFSRVQFQSKKRKKRSVLLPTMAL